MNEPTNTEIMALLQAVAADVADLYRDMIRVETRLCKLAVALGQEHVLGNGK